MDRVVEKFMLGPTQIIICDDKCVSKEEAEVILKDLARRIKPHIVEKSVDGSA
ncbi:hypothetical protein IMSAGC013_02449 [Lachnospiraceae bacterium]|nr:hypothetical protein IMSAGC013_02449 [Lachnospiraceae bacterium]